MVNEIDVSGCEKQGETVAGITCGIGERIRLANEIMIKHKLCKDNPNCIYKQLKRKEQECEDLKKANDGILTTIRILAKNNIKLREVLAKIKELAEYELNNLTDSAVHGGRYLEILQKIREFEE